MSLFCLQMTTLFVYDYGIQYDNPFPIHARTDLINESQLLGIAAKSANVRSLHLNRPVIDLTPEGVDRLAQLWPRLEELDLEKSFFKSQALMKFASNFPLLKKLKIVAFNNESQQLYDSVFSNHPNLVDFECSFYNGTVKNWFQSCDVPLQRFAVNTFLGDYATLDTLENCCKDSLQTIKVGLTRSHLEINSQIIHRIFSTFHELRVVSLGIFKYSALRSPPVLPRLEKLCLTSFLSDGFDFLFEFLQSYPQLKELHLEKEGMRDELTEKIVTTLPNLRSLSFDAVYTKGTILMKLTALKLEYFSPGIIRDWPVQDWLTFVREMPSLQRLTISNLMKNSNEYFLGLFKALRNEIRSSGSNRRLWVSSDDVLLFPLDSSQTCTDEAIEQFVTEMLKQERRKIGHCSTGLERSFTFFN